MTADTNGPGALPSGCPCAGPLGATGKQVVQRWPLETKGPWSGSKCQVGKGPEVGMVKECFLEEEAFQS